MKKLICWLFGHTSPCYYQDEYGDWVGCSRCGWRSSIPADYPNIFEKPNAERR